MSEQTEPHDSDGISIINDLVKYLRRFVVFSDSTDALVVALWCVHTHNMDLWVATPRLHVRSATRGTGKTRLLEILEQLTHCSVRSANATSAAIFRQIDSGTVTFILDEIDTVYGAKAGGDEQLRAVINAGYRRNSPILRSHQDGGRGTIQYEVFSAFALAGIGDLPATISSRCIPVTLHRRLPTEPVDLFDQRTARTETDILRNRIHNWLAKVSPALSTATPRIPASLHNRNEELARPLLAIAETASTALAKKAAHAISRALDHHADNDDDAEHLLADIRDVFEVKKVDRLPSKELLECLQTLETSPWATIRLTPYSLAQMIRPFGIAPQKLRTGATTRQGYYLDDFKPVFERYLPDSPTSHAGNPSGPQHTTNIKKRVPKADTNGPKKKTAKKKIKRDVRIEDPLHDLIDNFAEIESTWKTRGRK